MQRQLELRREETNAIHTFDTVSRRSLSFILMWVFAQ